jgi:hypothetical protein
MALALANVLFFAWAHWISTPDGAPTATASTAPALPTLSLADLPPAGTAPVALRCRSLGPFDTASAAQGVQEALRARGIEAQERRTETEVPDGYAVSIDGLRGAAEQRLALARLDRAGIHDAVALIQPTGAARIAVGMFPDQAQAVRRAEQVQLLGYKPLLDLRHRNVAAHWLDMSLRPSEPLPPLADFGDVAKSASFTDCPASNPGG